MPIDDNSRFVLGGDVSRVKWQNEKTNEDGRFEKSHMYTYTGSEVGTINSIFDVIILFFILVVKS